MEDVEDVTIHCNITSLTYEKKNEILVIIGLGAIVAVFVCLIAIGMLVLFKLYKYSVHRLAMYQVTAALFFAISCSLKLVTIKMDENSDFYHSFCIASGFLMEYSQCVKLMFTLCLTFHLFCFSVFHISLNRLELAHITVSIIIPLLFTWVPFVDDMYGQAGAWCWIKNWKNNTSDNKLEEGEIDQYTLLYGPEMLSQSLAIVAVIIIIVVLTQRAYGCCNCHIADGELAPLIKEEQISNLNKHKKVLKEVLPLVTYPILSFTLYIPAFINRLLGSINPCVSITSFIWSAVSLPLLSTVAGLVLIVHITIIKCSPNQKSTKESRSHVQRALTYKTDVFTTYTVGATTGRTYWEPSSEEEQNE